MSKYLYIVHVIKGFVLNQKLNNLYLIFNSNEISDIEFYGFELKIK
jgi:hypothetical protein